MVLLVMLEESDRYRLLAHVRAFPENLGIHVCLEMVGKINMYTFNVIKRCSSLPVEIPLAFSSMKVLDNPKAKVLKVEAMRRCHLLE